MSRYLLLGTLFLLWSTSCKTTSTPTKTLSNASLNSSPAELLDNQTVKLTQVSSDKTYGYTQKNPVKTGGGPAGERKYLNALMGPNGEAISYTRQGSCCPFKTPNGLLDNTGMLDIYEVTYAGLDKPIILYLDMYDYEELQAPVNFSFKK